MNDIHLKWAWIKKGFKILPVLRFEIRNNKMNSLPFHFSEVHFEQFLAQQCSAPKNVVLTPVFPCMGKTVVGSQSPSSTSVGSGKLSLFSITPKLLHFKLGILLQILRWKHLSLLGNIRIILQDIGADTHHFIFCFPEEKPFKTVMCCIRSDGQVQPTSATPRKYNFPQTQLEWQRSWGISTFFFWSSLCVPKAIPGDSLLLQHNSRYRFHNHCRRKLHTRTVANLVPNTGVKITTITRVRLRASREGFINTLQSGLQMPCYYFLKWVRQVFIHASL